MSSPSRWRNRPSRPSIRPSTPPSSGCPGRTPCRRSFRPQIATRSGNCRGGFSGILARHDRDTPGGLQARPIQLGSVRLGQPAFLHHHHDLHLRALLRQRPGGRSGEGPVGLGLHAVRIGHPDRADEPVPRRHGRRRRPAQTLHLRLPAPARGGLRRPVVRLSQPARPDRADQLGGDRGHGRRRDVDRVQQRAAAQHRAPRTHGPAERLRLGPRLLRRPHLVVPGAGRQHAGDVRPGGQQRHAAVRPRRPVARARTAGRACIGAVARAVRAADVPVHARFGRRAPHAAAGGGEAGRRAPWSRRCAGSAASGTRSPT